MKKYVNLFGIIYTILTFIFFRKIIKTDIGLVIYSTTTILLMFYTLYINKKVDLKD